MENDLRSQRFLTSLSQKFKAVLKNIELAASKFFKVFSQDFEWALR
jgi:hypothetical protein